MSEDHSFHAIMRQLDAGDEAAAAEIFHRFSRRLIARAHARLNARVRRTVDPEDVVHSVFRTFFRRQSEGQFEFDGWNGLWGLLVLLTLRKCGRAAESLHAACRDVRREVNREQLSDSEGNAWEAVARDPTPDEIVALAEIVEQIMGHLDPEQQRILALRLEGWSVREVSERVKLSERTVYRVQNAIKGRLGALCGLKDVDLESGDR